MVDPSSSLYHLVTVNIRLTPPPGYIEFKDFQQHVMSAILLVDILVVGNERAEGEKYEVCSDVFVVSIPPQHR
jgi:hypothetical protein